MLILQFIVPTDGADTTRAARELLTQKYKFGVLTHGMEVSMGPCIVFQTTLTNVRLPHPNNMSVPTEISEARVLANSMHAVIRYWDGRAI